MSAAPDLREPFPVPSATEAGNTPEPYTGSIVFDIGTANLAAADRCDLGRTPTELEALRDMPFPGIVVDGEHGVYLASGYQSQADAAVAALVAPEFKRLAENVGDNVFNGKTDQQAVALMHEVAKDVDNAVLLVTGPGPDNSRSPYEGGAASLGAVRFFVNDKGEQKAVTFGAGSVSVVYAPPDGTPTRLAGDQDQYSTETAEPHNYFAGEGRPTPNSAHSDRIAVVDVHPEGRFILVDDGVRGVRGGYNSHQQMPDAKIIAAEASGHPNVETAAQAVAEMGLGLVSDAREDDPHNPNYVPAADGVTAAVIEVRTSSIANRVNRAVKSLFGLVALRKSESNARQSARLQNARAEFKADRTASKRAKYIGVAAVGIALSGVGVYALQKAGFFHFAGELVGDGIQGAEHLVGLGDSHDGASGGHPSASPSASHPAETPGAKPSGSTPAPSNSTPAPGSSTPAPGGEKVNGSTGEYQLPGHGLPDDLPPGITLSQDDLHWLHASTGGGELGNYDPSSTPTDGLGREGTVWHTALSGLHDLGFDVDKMDQKQKTEYVEYVMSLNKDEHGNPLTWESAANLGDHAVINTPNNMDAILHLEDITTNHGQNPDGILLPTAGSNADEHINSIRHHIEEQINHPQAGNGAANSADGATAGLHPATGATAPPTRDPGVGNLPTSSATPHTHGSPSSSAAAAAPSHQGESGGSRIAETLTIGGAAGLLAAGALYTRARLQSRPNGNGAAPAPGTAKASTAEGNAARRAARDLAEGRTDDLIAAQRAWAAQQNQQAISAAARNETGDAGGRENDEDDNEAPIVMRLRTRPVPKESNPTEPS